jgi:hypothetical protein
MSPRPTVLVLLVCLASAFDVSAQPRGERRPAPPSPQVEAEAGVDRQRADRMDAESTRRELMEVLSKHPPSVARVMKLDPSLMRNESYLSAYPEIRDFLADHPEIPQNAGFYLERYSLDFHSTLTPPTPQQRMAEGILAGLAGFTAFGIILGTLVWLIRTVLDQRRWNRLSKIQAEVHTKLMDRFSSNDELLTYVQTPSGRRFLEAGPSPLQEMSPIIAAPFSRILWSVQLGAVLLVSGMGLLILSGRVIPEARDFFYITGCLATALGAGFVVSAAAAYLLSRRLGLLERPAQNNA